ncbi:MAG TPA: hypothetical protein GX699_10600 [Firmicutes bacterium]|nr:hypothetical protein [Bacillota bacterium]
MKNFKWHVAVLAFIFTLGIATGVVLLRQRQMIEAPLLKRIGELEHVRQVRLEEDGEKVIIVTLEYVSNLQETYRQLHTVITEMLGEENYRLELVDARNTTLEDAYFAVHLELYEGEQRGNFVAAGAAINTKLAVLDLDHYRFAVDGKYLYLQLKKGDAWLYEIVERQNGRAGEHA